MNTSEDRLRAALRDLADVVEPVPLLERLDASLGPRPWTQRSQRRLAGAAVAALTAAATVVGVVVVRQLDRPGIAEPALTPPKVIRMSENATNRPGAVGVALHLTLDTDASGESGDATPYLWAGRGEARRLPTSAEVPAASVQHLSADGTRFVRQNNRAGDPKLELIDLETGRASDLGGLLGYCPALSPDNTTLVMYSFANQLQLVDTRGGAANTTISSITEKGDCGHNSFGWSPDGTRLLVRTPGGSVVMNLDGRLLQRLNGMWPANSSMSWSPDGRAVLVYRQRSGDYALADVGTGSRGGTVELSAPAEFARPMGWAGKRVVWLVEDDDGARLVSTAIDGSDPRTWAVLDIGKRRVVAVEWSRDLAGTAR